LASSGVGWTLAIVEVGEIVLVAWMALSSIVVLALGPLAVSVVRRIRLFERLDPPPLETWPMLSVIVPACNEEATIGDALATLLAQDYPALEIIVVNDRSTDRTGEVVRRVASDDPRVLVIDVERLPEGWLGKVHALKVGSDRASGDFMLFTDADIHFEDDALRRAVAFADQDELDHLAILPKFIAPSFWLRSLIVSFGAGFLMSMGAHRVGIPGTRFYVGVGAFNLVRRSALARSEGLEWLRMEVGDDVGLGLLLHRAGARAGFLVAGEMISVTWYPTVAAMIRGLEKNMYGIACSYRLHRLFIAVPTSVAILLGPLVAITQLDRPWLMGMGITAFLAAGAYHLTIGRMARLGVVESLVAPWGVFVLLYIVVRSAYYCIKNGGVHWRGTFYPLDALRKGQRLGL